MLVQPYLCKLNVEKSLPFHSLGPPPMSKIDGKISVQKGSWRNSHYLQLHALVTPLEMILKKNITLLEAMKINIRDGQHYSRKWTKYY